MLHPRFWLLRTHALVFVVGLTLIIGTAFSLYSLGDKSAREAAVKTAPLAAITIGLASLGVAAASSLGNWRRQRREATIKAYADWSEGSIADRRAWTTHHGKEAMTRPAAKEALAVLKRRSDLQGFDPESQDYKDLGRAIAGSDAVVNVLNGLERLSVGVEVGAYDLTTLRKLGGTTIVRTYERAKYYIEERRKPEDEKDAQRTVFKSLEYVCGLINDHQGRVTNKIDKERIRQLRQER